MEDNNLENKMLKDFYGGLKDLNKLASGAIKTLDQKLRKELGVKGYAKYEAYKRKLASLHAEGKHKEAEQLEKEYRASE